jgi:uncharacterized membrane protein YqaE (UPF0057 family)
MNRLSLLLVLNSSDMLFPVDLACLAVFMKHGLGSTFLISLILTVIGWIPGVIHAFIVND